MANNLIIGARVQLYINGVAYAKVSDFQWAPMSPKKELRGIDSLGAFELVPTSFSISGSMTIYRQSNDGGAEGANMIAPQSAMTQETYFQMMLLEPSTGTVLFQAYQCSVVSQSWDASMPGGYIRGTIGWVGLIYSNELQQR